MNVMPLHKKKPRVGKVRARALVPAIALVLASCSGPNVPLNVGIDEVPGDVVLGSFEQAAQSVPVPPVSLPVERSKVEEFVAAADSAAGNPPPGSFDPTRPSGGGSRPGSPDSCPSADPLEAPAREAVRRIEKPPSQNAYLFRHEGSFEVSGPNTVRGKFPETSPRLVADPAKFTNAGTSRDAAWFRFEVEASLAPVQTTTTTYTIVPDRNPSGIRPGLYISRVRTEFGDGSEEDFRPANFPGLLLLPFPAVQGTTWDAAGADPRSGMAMTFSGRVGPKIRVDACGVPLDAITVQIDGDFGPAGEEGMTFSPGAVTHFTAAYGIGTQFGGIFLTDKVELNREFSNGNLHYEIHATINQKPGVPKADVPECTGECLPP